LLLEKQRLPRYKACAGGLSVKTVNLLGFDLGGVIEDTARQLVLSYKEGPRIARTADTPLVYMTMRERLDLLLADRASAAGASLHDNEPLLNFNPDGDTVVLTTGKAEYRTRVLVGADGFGSIVARRLGLTRGRRYDCALESEVTCPPAMLDEWRGKFYVDYGHCLHGYSWLFPKADHLSIGVCAPQLLAKSLRSQFHRLLRSLGLDGSSLPRFKSSYVGFRGDGVPLTEGRCLLLGDAAGLADALTGEGIYYAVRSAQLAVPPIASYLERQSPDLGPYQQSVDSELMPEIRLSERLAAAARRVPRIAYNFVSTSDAAWSAFCRLVRGETKYTRLRLELSPFKLILGL
jgi:flavin-dependent dehydrogenase